VPGPKLYDASVVITIGTPAMPGTINKRTSCVPGCDPDVARIIAERGLFALRLYGR
jgi:hypothetical protein